MKSSGMLLAVVGVWVLCQLFGGNALGRLGIVDASAASSSGIAGGSASGSREPPAPPSAGGRGVPVTP